MNANTTWTPTPQEIREIATMVARIIDRFLALRERDRVIVLDSLCLLDSSNLANQDYAAEVLVETILT